jgi:hypothetical protein
MFGPVPECVEVNEGLLIGIGFGAWVVVGVGVSVGILSSVMNLIQKTKLAKNRNVLDGKSMVNVEFPSLTPHSACEGKYGICFPWTIFMSSPLRLQSSIKVAIESEASKHPKMQAKVQESQRAGALSSSSVQPIPVYSLSCLSLYSLLPGWLPFLVKPSSLCSIKLKTIICKQGIWWFISLLPQCSTPMGFDVPVKQQSQLLYLV